MKHSDPQLAREIASRLDCMTDSELARYMRLVRTIAECARYMHHARQARHMGCNSAASEFETYAHDALNRYAYTVNETTTIGVGL